MEEVTIKLSSPNMEKAVDEFLKNLGIDNKEHLFAAPITVTTQLEIQEDIKYLYVFSMTEEVLNQLRAHGDLFEY